jgi:hypothetical protein
MYIKCGFRRRVQRSVVLPRQLVHPARVTYFAGHTRGGVLCYEHVFKLCCLARQNIQFLISLTSSSLQHRAQNRGPPVTCMPTGSEASEGQQRSAMQARKARCPPRGSAKHRQLDCLKTTTAIGATVNFDQRSRFTISCSSLACYGEATAAASIYVCTAAAGERMTACRMPWQVRCTALACVRVVAHAMMRLQSGSACQLRA